MINKDWHLAHRMLKNATLDQRVQWHVEHLKHCACRTDLPPAIATEIQKRGLSAKPAAKKVAAPKTKSAFTAPIIGTDGGGAYVEIPEKIIAALGGKGRIPINATFDGAPYRGSLFPMGGCHMVLVLKAIRAKIGKGPGDTVRVVLAADTRERTMEPPADLQKPLNKNKPAKAFFDKLSYTHRREYVQWIEAAKRPETRARRIEKTIAMLTEGIKEP